MSAHLSLFSNYSGKSHQNYGYLHILGRLGARKACLECESLLSLRAVAWSPDHATRSTEGLRISTLPWSGEYVYGNGRPHARRSGRSHLARSLLPVLQPV